MYGFYGFRSIREGLIFIAINSAILTIVLLYDYRRKRLEKKHKDLKSQIFDSELVQPKLNIGDSDGDSTPPEFRKWNSTL